MLNQFIGLKAFGKVTIRRLQEKVQLGHQVTIVVLKDAYFHVEVALKHSFYALPFRK